KLSPNVSNTFKTTISLNSSKNSTQSVIVPVSPKMLLVQATNGDMRSYPSVKNSVKVINLTLSMKLFMPKVIPARLVSKPTLPKQQSILKFCLLDHQKYQICYLN
ncbi:unnamed protein product, partial [Hymenolepis diminuta]